MKVLWITNIVFPEAQALLTGKGELTASGGWMVGSANSLIEYQNIELTVAAPTQHVSELTELQGKKIRYFLFPLGKGNLKKNDEYRKFWRQIHDLVNPDLVHIHGTEFSHGLAYVDECGADKVVVSIQGLTSAYYYYYYGLKKGEIFWNMTLGDLLHGGGIVHYARQMKQRSVTEIELLRKINHIIGRTDWDRAHVWAINSEAKYHFCNETLRDEFYTGCWDYAKCKRHTIFLSQANNPIKGLHMVLRALPIVKKIYPEVRVRVAGRDITSHDNSLRGIYGYSGYGRLIKNMIKKYHVESNVTFIGPLNAEEMKREYLNCNAFISPSTIENSPNSLGEAQLLGVPCIASCVGGVQNMIPNKDCGYIYRFEEIELLAYAICDVFKNSSSFDNIMMRKEAHRRHDKQINSENLIRIYNSL